MSVGVVIYLILLVSLGGYAVFYLEFASLQILLMALFLPIIMFILLILIRKSVYVEVETKSPVVEKKSLMGTGEIVLLVTVENTSSWLPLLRGTIFLSYENAFSGEKGKRRLHFSADCQQKQTKELVIPIHSVGDVELTINKIKIYDYLNIFSWKLMKKQDGGDVLVLPPMKEIFLEKDCLVGDDAGDSDKYSPYKKGEDASEIFDIREYEDGDKIQRIHWKLSYKKQTLMVKEYSLPLANATVIFVDFSLSRIDHDKEKLVSILVQGIYSISMELLENELSQRFVWYDANEDVIREEMVKREEELLWTLQEMFKAKITDDSHQLHHAYEVWDDKKPVESGLYLTVNDACQVEGRDFHVRRLQMMNLKEE